MIQGTDAMDRPVAGAKRNRRPTRRRRPPHLHPKERRHDANARTGARASTGVSCRPPWPRTGNGVPARNGAPAATGAAFWPASSTRRSRLSSTCAPGATAIAVGRSNCIWTRRAASCGSTSTIPMTETVSSACCRNSRGSPGVEAGCVLLLRHADRRGCGVRMPIE